MIFFLLGVDLILLSEGSRYGCGGGLWHGGVPGRLVSNMIACTIDTRHEKNVRRTDQVFLDQAFLDSLAFSIVMVRPRSFSGIEERINEVSLIRHWKLHHSSRFIGRSVYLPTRTSKYNVLASKLPLVNLAQQAAHYPLAGFV